MNKETELEKEALEYSDQVLYAIQCAERMAEIVGEDCGYLAPPFWIKAREWVRQKLIPADKAYYYSWSSYGLKHLMYDDTRVYMTNSQFKMLMIECGYLPKDPTQQNWNFKISRKSPAFRKNERSSDEK